MAASFPTAESECQKTNHVDLSRLLLCLTSGLAGFSTNGWNTWSSSAGPSVSPSHDVGPPAVALRQDNILEGNSGSESDVSSNDSDTTDQTSRFDQLQPPRKRHRPSTLHSPPPPTVATTAGGGRGRLGHLVRCVQHDHCYASSATSSPRGQRSSAGSEGDVSVEEENSSDPGEASLEASLCTHVCTCVYHCTFPLVHEHA